MSLILRSRATADLLLVNSLAKDLMGVLGKDPLTPGILQVADMPSALAKLKALPDAVPEPELDDDEADAPRKPDLAFADEAVPLRRRAVPLIQMIERAQAEDQPIVWGV